MRRKGKRIINVPGLDEKVVCVEGEGRPYYTEKKYLEMAGELLDKKGRKRIGTGDRERASEEMIGYLAAYSPSMVELLTKKGGAESEH